MKSFDHGVVSILALILALHMYGYARADTIARPNLTELIQYAKFSEGVYHDDFKPVDGGWQKSLMKNELNGLNWALYERTLADGSQEIVIAFAGTEFSDRARTGLDLRDLHTDFRQGLIGPDRTPQYTAAEAIAREVMRNYQGKNVKITLTGHSLGGGIAQYVAAKLGLHAFVFNAAPLGPVPKLTRQMISQAQDRIVNVSTHGEPVHGILGMQQLGSLLSFKAPPGIPGIFDKDIPLLAYVDLEHPFKNPIAAPLSFVDGLILEPWSRHHAQQLLIQALEYENAYGAARDAWLASPAGQKAQRSWEQVKLRGSAVGSETAPGGVVIDPNLVEVEAEPDLKARRQMIPSGRGSGKRSWSVPAR